MISRGRERHGACNRSAAMLTRSTLTALAAALVLSASPGAFAASQRGAKPRVKVKSRSGSTTGTRTGRVPVTPRASGMGRVPRTSVGARTAAASVSTRPAARGARTFHPTPKPSVAKNVGWGAFFAAIGVASVATGGAGAVGGLVIGGGAAAYNFVKAYLNNRKTTTAEQSRSVAYNAGWGTLFAGMAVQGIATGDPLSAAIGIGAGAYNLIKAGMGYGKLPQD